MYNTYSKHCFQINVDKKGDWYTAKADCERQGGHLAVLQSWTDDSFIGLRTHVALAFHKDEHLWIGLSDEEYEGNFKWINSKDLPSLFYVVLCFYDGVCVICYQRLVNICDPSIILQC